MKKSLIAIAAATVLASGAAIADSYTFRVGGGAPVVVVDDNQPHYRVQYDNHPNYRDPQYDDRRQLSIDERQARLHARIERGFHAGQLTRREARQLERHLARTEEKERAFEADGRLNGRERAELHRDLDWVAQQLRFERHDAEYRN